jgi:hypothetical protein
VHVHNAYVSLTSLHEMSQMIHSGACMHSPSFPLQSISPDLRVLQLLLVSDLQPISALVLRPARMDAKSAHPASTCLGLLSCVLRAALRFPTASSWAGCALYFWWLFISKCTCMCSSQLLHWMSGGGDNPGAVFYPNQSKDR